MLVFSFSTDDQGLSTEQSKFPLVSLVPEETRKLSMIEDRGHTDHVT